MFRKSLLYLFLFLSVLQFQCEREQEETVVLTEAILLLSGERVRMSGRIYSLANEQISEHGFEVSTTNQFIDPIVVSLGEKSDLGSFIGETNDLISNTNYFFRAFVISDRAIVYGNAINFNSLNLSISSFSPSTAYEGDELTIIGANFSSDVSVFFNDAESEIVSLELESILKVEVPDIEESVIVKIRVENENSNFEFEIPFEYIYGLWENTMNFSSSNKFIDGLAIDMGDQFIMGLGQQTGRDPINPLVWKYNKLTEEWTLLDFDGTPFRGGFYCSEGYFGAGARVWLTEFGPDFSNDMWKYENDAFTYLGTVPYDVYRPICFVYNSKLYLVGGLIDSNEYSNLIYSYDEHTTQWKTENTLVPFDISMQYPSFEYNELYYFISPDQSIWTLDLSTLEFNHIGEAPFGVLKEGISAVIGNKAYIGLFRNENEIREYDISNGIWKEKMFINDLVRNRNVALIPFEDGFDLIRVDPDAGTGDFMEIWQFNPNLF